MPVLTTPQEPSWDSNVYVLATTRIMVLVGTAYLVRSLYNLVSTAWGSHHASVAAAAVSRLVLEEINSDILATVPGAPRIGPDLEASVQLPQHHRNPHRHVQRSQANVRAYDQPLRTPDTSDITNAIPEQDVGVRNHGAQIEERSGISVGLVD